MELKRLSRMLKTVSNEKRLRILALLEKSDRSICVCEFVDALDMPQYQVSQHLRELRNEKIVTGERKGTWVYYSLSEELPPGPRSIIDTLVKGLDNKDVEKDVERLSERMEKREGGKCVVGYEDEDE